MGTKRKAVVAAVLVACAVTAWGTSAMAQSTAVYRKYKGRIVVSDGPIQLADDDKRAVAALEKAARSTIQRPEGASSWPFYFVAFMSRKAGAADLTLLFFDVSGGDRKPGFYRDITVDPESTIVAFDLEFSEDDGVKPGVKYEVVLARVEGSKHDALAQAKVAFK